MSDHEHESVYPEVTPDIAQQRRTLAPKQTEAFKAFSKSVFADGALPGRPSS